MSLYQHEEKSFLGYGFCSPCTSPVLTHRSARGIQRPRSSLLAVSVQSLRALKWILRAVQAGHQPHLVIAQCAESITALNREDLRFGISVRAITVCFLWLACLIYKIALFTEFDWLMHKRTSLNSSVFLLSFFKAAFVYPSYTELRVSTSTIYFTLFSKFMLLHLSSQRKTIRPVFYFTSLLTTPSTTP